MSLKLSSFTQFLFLVSGITALVFTSRSWKAVLYPGSKGKHPTAFQPLKALLAGSLLVGKDEYPIHSLPQLQRYKQTRPVKAICMQVQLPLSYISSSHHKWRLPGFLWPFDISLPEKATSCSWPKLCIKTQTALRGFPVTSYIHNLAPVTLSVPSGTMNPFCWFCFKILLFWLFSWKLIFGILLLSVAHSSLHFYFFSRPLQFYWGVGLGS